MTDLVYQRPSDEYIERERIHANQSGGGGSGGGGSSGGSGSGGGGSSGNESRENPRYTGRGDSRGNQGQEQHRNEMSQGREQQQSQGQNQPQSQQYQNQPQSQNKEQPMTFCPPAFGAVAPYAFNPYATPYAYGAGIPPVAPAGANVVVADTGHGKSAAEANGRLDVVGDLVVGNQIQAANSGHFAQLSSSINGIGDRIDTQASFGRDLSHQRSFFDMSKANNDTESRIMARIGDQENRFLTEMKNAEIRHLQENQDNLKTQLIRSEERFQFRELRDELQDIKRALRDNRAV